MRGKEKLITALYSADCHLSSALKLPPSKNDVKIMFFSLQLSFRESLPVKMGSFFWSIHTKSTDFHKTPWQLKATADNAEIKDACIYKTIAIQ